MQPKKVLERVERYVSLTLSPWVVFHAFCHLLNFFKFNIFERFFQDAFGVSNSFDQKVWNQIRPDILSGLIWFQTFCKSFQQTARRKWVNLFPIRSNFYPLLFLFCLNFVFICSSHLLMFLGSLYCKQYGPRSDQTTSLVFIVFASVIKRSLKCI